MYQKHVSFILKKIQAPEKKLFVLKKNLSAGNEKN